MATKQKHVPIRMCAVCREKGGKRTFTRVVRTEEGVMIDPSGKANGRGAYLCDNPECWQRAAKSDVLNHALKTILSMTDRERIRQVVP
jgi:predicted RNA-binding protein YlxR (DUF448 family)